MPTVLCVEDESQIRAEIVGELEDCGYKTIEAGNGVEGLKAIIEHRPDMVLCDISMPVMGGFELLDTLRKEHSEFACTPFVFISALAEPDDVIQGKMRGGDDYITKPIDFVDLLATLEARLSQVARIVEIKETEKDEMRGAILRNIPHELRTPLNHIIGFSEILKDQMLGPINNDKYTEYANNIYTSGCDLLDKINDAISIIDAISGIMTPKKDAQDINLLIRECVDDVSGESRQKNIRISTDIRGAVPLMYTDGDLLRKAISALLSNAIKFSSDGEQIMVAASFDRDRGFCISVSDHGVGIMAQDVPRILKAFEQVDGSISRKFQGAGLGLTLAKEITETVGGSIHLDSELGAGTTIRMTFPADQQNLFQATGNGSLPHSNPKAGDENDA